MAYKHYHTHFTSREPAKAVEFYQRMFGAKVLRSFVLYGGVDIWDLEVGGLMLRISGSTGAEESGGVTERLRSASSRSPNRQPGTGSGRIEVKRGRICSRAN